MRTESSRDGTAAPGFRKSPLRVRMNQAPTHQASSRTGLAEG